MTPVCTKDSKPLGRKGNITRAPRDWDTCIHLKKSWYTPDTVNLENPIGLTILEIESSCTYNLSAIEGVYIGGFPILAIPTANSEQPQYALYMQLPQHTHLRINDAQRCTIFIVFAIPNSGALQYINISPNGYTRVVDDGPRNFDRRSSDKDDICELTLPLQTTTLHQREDFKLNRFNVH
ncbi:uncharacterized protein TNCV_361281 [Trichonephila clavipes]|nr:uncharacterized protein TNCV_361281 [Trichonephila clavipes]